MVMLNIQSRHDRNRCIKTQVLAGWKKTGEGNCQSEPKPRNKEKKGLSGEKSTNEAPLPFHRSAPASGENLLLNLDCFGKSSV